MTELSAKKREKDKIKAKELRNTGFVPGVVYGKNEPAIALSVAKKSFESVYKEAGETKVIDLEIEGEAQKTSVLIFDVAKDPLTEEVLHVDFYRVRMDEKIEAKIPLKFVGESPAVKNDGGVLVKSLQEIEVSALPQDLLQEIEIDISALKTFDDIIYIKDLNLPPSVEILGEPETPVALVTPPRSEKELEELESEVGEGVSEEVAAEEKEEGEEKKEEEGKEQPVPAQDREKKD